MDQHYRVGGSDFVWNLDKTAMNVRKHGVRFEDAATVFMDPLFVSPMRRATTKHETR